MRTLERTGLLPARAPAAGMWFYVQHVMVAHQLTVPCGTTYHVAISPICILGCPDKNSHSA